MQWPVRSVKAMEYLLTLLIIISLNFALPRLMPGDPFLHTAGDVSEVVTIYTTQQLDYFREYYGLHRPIHQQYFSYLKELAQFDLGFSYYYKENVATLIASRIPWTLLLVVSATALSVTGGIILGSYSAWHQGKWQDRWLYLLMVVLGEIPAFLVGIFLLILLAAHLDLFPLAGAVTHFATYNSYLDRVIDILYHGALPALTLALTRIGGFYLLVRNSLLAVMTKDYIRTARAKGLSDIKIRYVHGLRNALLPLVTRVAMQMGAMLGGAVLAENVFSYPGLGLLMRDAVFVRDYPLLQGIFLVLAFMVLVANILADWLYQRLDPRVKKVEMVKTGEKNLWS